MRPESNSGALRGDMDSGVIGLLAIAAHSNRDHRGGDPRHPCLNRVEDHMTTSAKVDWISRSRRPWVAIHCWEVSNISLV